MLVGAVDVFLVLVLVFVLVLGAFLLLVPVCAKAKVAVPATNPRPSIRLIIFFIEVFLLVVSGGLSRFHCQSCQADMKAALTRN